MSYQLFLYRKSEQEYPFLETEIREKIKETRGHITTDLSNGDVIEFEIYFSFADIEKDTFLRFIYRYDLNCYWTYLPYLYDLSLFKKFLYYVCDISSKLDLLIYDNQVSDIIKLENPDDFIKEKDIASNIFLQHQENTTKFINFLEANYLLKQTAVNTNFLLYRVESKDPRTGNKLYLNISKDRVLAGKINPGETLGKIIKDDLNFLDEYKYKIVKIKQNCEKVKNSKGEFINRHHIYIEVPFFDTSRLKNIYPYISWSEHFTY